MNRMFFSFFIVIVMLLSQEIRADSGNTLLTTDQIRIRDPYILVDRENSTYYMYSQAGNRAESHFTGVEVYTSQDLKHWTEPVPVLTLPKKLQVKMVWAPEVHFYNGKYYMFVTLTFDDIVSTPSPIKDKNWPPMYKRGTWIFRADSPKGPFLQIKEGSHTPIDWMALDGTLWEENGKPYMIFCHEWVQIIDGTMNLLELKKDLSETIGEQKLLFAASSAPHALKQPNVGKVTDGPFLYKSPKSGTLYMIWSTFVSGVNGYCLLLTQSENGSVTGPWSKSTLLYTKDGGHGMIFTSLKGQLILAIHLPNVSPKESLKLLEIVDDGTTLKIKELNTSAK